MDIEMIRPSRPKKVPEPVTTIKNESNEQQVIRLFHLLK